MKNMLGTKIGMTQIFDDGGNVVPVTVIEAGPCVVTQIKTKAIDGYNAVQVGFGKTKKINKPLKGHLKEATCRHLREFKVENPEDFKLGQEVKVEIFKPGDKVAIAGVSIGKGFAGTIKRHRHHRGPMSHGSKFHRLPGSIGAGTTPGRVYKGRAMPGHMGSETVTAKNLRVIKVETEKNLLLVRGAVPGKPGNLLVIKKTAEAKA